MGQQHIKLYSNEERNGSTTYTNYIVMRKGKVMRKGMGQQHIKTI